MRYILFLALFLGCEKQLTPDQHRANLTTLATEGEEVGVLPDGRSLRRYEINCPVSGGCLTHYVYIVNGSITVNRLEQQGKAQINRVEVIIDGVKYKPESER